MAQNLPRRYPIAVCEKKVKIVWCFRIHRPIGGSDVHQRATGPVGRSSFKPLYSDIAVVRICAVKVERCAWESVHLIRWCSGRLCSIGKIKKNDVKRFRGGCLEGEHPLRVFTGSLSCSLLHPYPPRPFWSSSPLARGSPCSPSGTVLPGLSAALSPRRP